MTIIVKKDALEELIEYANWISFLEPYKIDESDLKELREKVLKLKETIGNQV